MKKLLLISICLTSFLLNKAQVPNDDCSTATDLGTLSIAWTELYSDGTNDYSVSTYGGTFNATDDLTLRKRIIIKQQQKAQKQVNVFHNSNTTLANNYE